MIITLVLFLWAMSNAAAQVAQADIDITNTTIYGFGTDFSAPIFQSLVFEVSPMFDVQI